MASPPPGYTTVTPRMFVRDVAGAAAFLHEAFGATGDVVEGRPAELRIQECTILIADERERGRFPAFLYVYVDDVAATYVRALAAGATSLEEPLDTPYGDRRAMVGDPFGNIFQIARRLGT
jgi:PhnB protein